MPTIGACTVLGGWCPAARELFRRGRYDAHSSLAGIGVYARGATDRRCAVCSIACASFMFVDVTDE